ncbi:putative bifunctional diguanylate cyclase/phosphodiesterase [Pseudophaeobacter leonis]|uniref:putative bifunctional diguanylate cyclase/phosphodiesterase n=1 Tax=Pseudophaeobacter leonis TaxID=1144477 RepID=UPI0009F3423D|nr:bifunctional diguanylate cyclase/phosphodiesterase [Pseudophaeobacter leonis]
MWNLKFLLFCVVGLAAGISATIVLRAGKNTILREYTRQGGMEFAGYIEREMPNLDQILLGTFDRGEAEAELNRLAVIGNVFRFEFYDDRGNQVLATGSFHSEADDASDSHHAHEHEEQALTHLPRPEIMTQATSSETDHSQHSHASLSNIDFGEGLTTTVLAPNDPHAAVHHVLQIYTGDGRSTPATFASLIHPISDSNGALAGTVVLYQDLSAQAALQQSVLLKAAGAIVALFVLSTMGPLISYFGALRAKNAADEEIHYLAAHDGLTGLVNRETFISKVEQCFSQDDAFAVHFLDVDNFKYLNDSFGHEVGDVVLRTFASRLSDLADNALVIARLGGDEFAILQRNAKDSAAMTSVSQKVLEVIRAPIVANDHTVAATASMGSARAPDDGKDVTRLIKSADIAMYHSKSEGRNRACVFETWMDEKLMARREIESRLHWALEHDGFEIHYQPLYSAKMGKLLGFEALLRLNREDGTPISPEKFIPIAEDMRLIEDIGTWVLYQACAFASNWPRNLKLAVNLSVGQFASGKLPEIVELALWESKLASTQLELEITESFLLDDSLDTLTQLRELKGLGISVAMDDFGTGYSSLAYLWQFPFDKVKIDQSFLKGFSDRAAEITKIIETIVGLGHTLGMQITAEGVETQEQLEMLKTTHCDQLQGFLLGKPVSKSGVQLCIISDQEGKGPGLEESA